MAAVTFLGEKSWKILTACSKLLIFWNHLQSIQTPAFSLVGSDLRTYEFELIEKEQLEHVGPSGLPAINGRNEMLKGIIVNNRPNSMQ
jgi:hypothetical protein